MDKALFDGIKQGMKQAALYADAKKHGKSLPPGLREHCVQVPGQVDVKAIRARMGMTQSQFANTFGFSLSGLKKWEANVREPEAAARILLRTIDRFPDKVIEANRT